MVGRTVDRRLAAVQRTTVGDTLTKKPPQAVGKGKKERGGTTDEEKKPLSVTVPPSLCTSEFSFVIRGTADHSV